MATAVSEKQRNNVVNNSEDTVGVDSKSALQNGSADVSSDPVSGSVGVDNKSSNSFSMSQYLQQEGSRSGHPVSEDKSVNVKHAMSGDAEGSPGGYVQRGSHGEPLGGSDPSSPYRHGFPSTKTGMIPPRSPGGVFSQQRFMSGQSISQPTGPTPTLNQLLQTTNAIQRMQNSYGHSGGPDPGGIYSQQSWPPQQSPHSVYGGQSASSPGAPPGQVYRNPSPELAGQNSNDSCSGAGAGAGAPGTPNSQQGMRPTPSPTGSTGSRSMSPAVGQQNIQMPPRPSSSQSDGSGPTRMNHSPMATQGGYQGPPPPPHIAGYKLPGGAGASGPPGSGQPLPPYSAPQQQGMPPQPHSQYSSPQGNYTVRPQGNMQYGPNQVYGGLPNPGQPNASPNLGPNQYPSRSMPNHFPGYPQSWSGSPSLNQGPPGPPNKGGPGGVSVSQPSSTSPSLHSTNSQSSRPPNYLKQHLQHKMTFGGSGLGIVPSHSPPQGYGMGPPGSGAMHHPGPMGPPPMGGGGHIPMSMGPPNMAPPSSTNSHDSSGGPMPPPSTTPNSHTSSIPEGDSPAHDNGITTTAAGNVGTHVTSAGGGTVTSVVTTGPDGTPLDEGSQQSTLSNASVASGEDPQCSTPKSRKSEMGGGGSGGGHYSHPATPQSTVPSPGAASINSMHGADEYDISSPSWPRTPASPVFNSHVPPPETYRSKKSDSLSKLYEMDDSPERRAWLDKLLAFMEERRTPITTCPTISKNPLDLFRLYIFVKERGGFMEVTKNKTWKDIAGMLGIGASSSAAYTLRKHYTKNLLAFECKFDRGGIDPQPIINQVEATSKKKSAKAASVPSPGSSNSQDSFPTPGSGNASMDGYGAYGYPSGSTADYNSPPMQRPSSQANAPSPHPGVANHHGQQGNATGDNISVSNPFDDVASGQPQRYPGGAAVSQSGSPYGPGGAQRGQGYPGQPAGGYSQYPAPGSSPDPYQNYSNNSSYPPTTRPVGYPSYSPDGERGGGSFNQSGSTNMTTSMASNMATNNPTASTAATAQDPYNRYGAMGGANQATSYVPPPPAGTRQTYTSGASTTPPSSQSSSQPQPGSYPGQQDYYRNDPNYPSGGGQTSPGGGTTATQVYGNGPHSKAMPPPAPQPRRHPDFAKDQQYPPYSQQKPQMYGWPNNQYRGQYPGQAGAASSSTTGQQWAPGSGPVRGTTPAQPGGPAGAVPGPTSWGSDHRYPPSPGTTGQPGTTPAGYQSSVQPPPGQQQWSGMSAPGQGNSLRPAGIGTRPPFRAEGKPTFNMPPPQGLKTTAGPSSTTGSSYTPQPIPKREITFPPDSVEATTPVLYRRKRLCRADVAPLDAWRIMMCLRSGLLAESTWALDVLNVLLFDDSSVAYFGLAHMPGLLDVLLEHFQRSLSDMFDTGAAESRNDPWYEKRVEECETVDLGAVEKPIDPEDHTVVLSETPDYTMVSRKGRPVKAVPKDDIFVLDTDKDWDVDGEQSERSVAEATTDPWHPLGAVDGFESTKHILTCFRAEFGDIPFARVLRPHEKPNTTVSISTTDGVNASETNGEELEEGECDGDDRKTISGDGEKTVKRRTTKSLSDVLARIKDSAENARREEKENKTESEADVPDASGEASGGSDMCGPSCTPDSRDSTGGPHIRDPAGTLKRRRVSDYEDEAYSRDESSLYLVTETQESLGKRCVCISNVLRNLTFVPGNETEFAKSPAFLGLLGKLLLLHHDHPPRTPKTRNYDREEDADFAEPRPGTSGARDGEAPWWWDFLAQARENALVAAANVAGHMDLGAHDEAAARPVLDGLLHWAVCPSAHGQDALPSAGPTSALSPRRLALEALCKLCVTDSNVDLVVATPPYSRLERLCAILTKMLCRSEEPTLREFAINLLHYLSAADSGVARTVALQSPCVSLLVAFIEQAEQSALGIANQHGVGALRDNPDAMGTSLDMLRRAARTLLHLARHPDNRPLFLQQEQRLLGLVMSQILDQQVASIVSRVLYQCSRPPDALPPSSS